MTHKQHPLGSGFSAAASAQEVIAGIDLSGKYAVVTGGNAGIRLEVTRALANAGAIVVVASRNPKKAADAVGGLERIETSRLDLGEPASIEAFVARYLGMNRPLHILFNNAGVPSPKQIVRDVRGYEQQFATNHLGHFQLSNGLLPALRAANGARIVNLSSGAQRFGQIRWDDPNFTAEYNSSAAYAQSKLANVLLSVELDRRWSAFGVRGYAVHPGIIVGTQLNSAAGPDALRAMGLIDDAGHAIIDPARGRKTPQQGASTPVFAATSPLLANIGGVYLQDNDIAPLDDTDRPMDFDHPPTEPTSRSVDPIAAQRLWALSERLLAA